MPFIHGVNNNNFNHIDNMAKYESVTIFDGMGASMKLDNPDKNGVIEIHIEGIGHNLVFRANTDKQSDIIQHFINYNPDCKDLALNRVSYELLTIQNRFGILVEKYHKVCEELEQLK